MRLPTEGCQRREAPCAATRGPSATTESQRCCAARVTLGHGVPRSAVCGHTHTLNGATATRPPGVG